MEPRALLSEAPQSTVLTCPGLQPAQGADGNQIPPADNGFPLSILFVSLSLDVWMGTQQQFFLQHSVFVLLLLSVPRFCSLFKPIMLIGAGFD